jgi:GT2 family glycosyltransferase
MKKIAALLTCFNRREKTLAAIHSLYQAYDNSNDIILLDVYLTDDGSTDGTAEEVKTRFPQVKIQQVTGNLYWANGMRNSWKAALNKEYDTFLLLNDDVELYPGAFNLLRKTCEFCLENYKEPGIYIGATEDKNTNKLTYSGSIVLNKFLYTQKRLEPNGSYQACDLANANIMLVPKEIVDKIGILTGGYSHGIADYDYTLTASKKNIPIIVAPEYCGHCEDDHRDLYDGFADKALKDRKTYLFSPTGLAYKSYMKYMRKFFPFRYPLVVFFAWLKLYFPRVYLKYFRER